MFERTKLHQLLNLFYELSDPDRFLAQHPLKLTVLDTNMGTFAFNYYITLAKKSLTNVS